MFDWLEFDFMTRAFFATSVLSLSVAPVGAFLVLRKLSPLARLWLINGTGIVIGFLGGLSVFSMVTGGLIAGIFVIATTVIARSTILQEDASMHLYLIALALGIFILSVAGSAIPLKSFLFGSILGMGDETLYQSWYLH